MSYTHAAKTHKTSLYPGAYYNNMFRPSQAYGCIARSLCKHRTTSYHKGGPERHVSDVYECEIS